MVYCGGIPWTVRGFCGCSNWFKILISITAIEFAINTHSMEFLGHNSVEFRGFLWTRITDSMD